MTDLATTRTDADLDRITHVGPRRDLAPGARNRFVVPTENYAQHSPFIVLVEDFMEPQARLPAHPHRGFETATYVLDGHLSHFDHLGTHGVSGPRSVQWMTAGAGILHGGEPTGGSAQALQLWLNLPARLKMSVPASREQSRNEAEHTRAAGVSVLRFGNGTPQETVTWSLWPLQIIDLVLDDGASHVLDVEGRNRLLAYVLFGEVEVGENRCKLVQGDIGWLDPNLSEPERTLRFRATRPARVIIYASPPIDEDVAATGPFVMNTPSEIREAFAELETGTFLDRRGIGPDRTE